MDKDKKSLRQSIRELKRTYPAAALDAQSDLLMSRLEAHERFQTAHVVMLFCALPDEPNTLPLLERWASQKTFVLPVVCGDDMVIKRYEGRTSLRTGAYRILEPVGDEFTAYDQIDLIVVPGMAFDRQGHRLGRGKGYYDRFLCQPDLAKAYKLGIAFEFQILEEVPTDRHDILMDEVLTLG